MASTIMHIAVANELYKKINSKLHINYYDYILGTIAPDISKIINEPREISHFIEKENELPDINNFLEKYHSTLTNSFNLGYFIHLYTDKLFFKDYYPLFIQDGMFTSIVKKIDGDIIKIRKDDKKKMLYNDYSNLNTQLIDEYQLNLDLFYNEFIQPKTNITEIPINKLNLLIEEAGIIIQNVPTTKEYIIDISSIISFIDNCIDEIYYQLIILNIIN
jgi:hypothetical protein